MTNRISKAKLILREEGRLVLFRRVMLFLKQSLCAYSCCNIYESTLDPPDIKCQVDGLTIRVITTLEELASLETDPSVDKGFDMPRNRELLSMGAILLCAFVDRDLAHVTQVAMSQKAHEAEPFSFAVNYGEWIGIMGAFTAPKYRGKGLNTYVRTRTLQYLKEQGVARAWDLPNPTDINTVKRVGMSLWGEGCRLRLLSRLTFEWTRPKSRVASRHMRCSLKRG